MKTVIAGDRVFLLLDDKEIEERNVRTAIVGDQVFILLDDEEAECEKVTNDR